MNKVSPVRAINPLNAKVKPATAPVVTPSAVETVASIFGKAAKDAIKTPKVRTRPDITVPKNINLPIPVLVRKLTKREKSINSSFTRLIKGLISTAKL